MVIVEEEGTKVSTFFGELTKAITVPDVDIICKEEFDRMLGNIANYILIGELMEEVGIIKPLALRLDMQRELLEKSINNFVKCVCEMAEEI